MSCLLLELCEKGRMDIDLEKASIADECDVKGLLGGGVSGKMEVDYGVSGVIGVLEQRGQSGFVKAGNVGKKSVLASRYIPVRVRNVLQKEFGAKCSISGCYRPSEVIHHTARFAISYSHNPRFLAPLCKEHHVLAHSVDLVFGRYLSGVLL